MDVNIRTIRPGDFEQLPPLLSELGYPASPDEIKKRYQKILDNLLYHTFVAEQNREIIGLLGMHMELSYVNNQPAARIIAMVVSLQHRNKGIGKQLMNQAEKTARENNAYMIVLNSGNRPERKGAHRFYEGLGFQGTATGFYKRL
ncbi:MAG: GNAT family N-acetyltransferase [Bacillaceae bacterium]|nr:GNAT family N-acetyltransferase [Bacillaceae bacterium]